MSKLTGGSDDLVSVNERQFISDAIKQGRRIDGRAQFDYRTLRIAFGSSPGRVQIQLGQTKVQAVTTCDILAPYPDRPTEGFFKFEVEFSPMASPAFEGGRPSLQAIELTRVVERGLRESGAIDTEALCIVAGERVWSIRVDIHILDDDGNLIDACGIAAICALHHFRRPDVTIAGDSVTIHSSLEREPVPLSIHHMPVAVSFGVFTDGELVVDPTWKEEKVIQGKMTMTLNAQHELCAIQKAGGVPLSVAEILKATKIASVKVSEISQAILKALSDDVQSKKNQQRTDNTFGYIAPGIGLQEDVARPDQSRLRFFDGLKSVLIESASGGLDAEGDDVTFSDADIRKDFDNFARTLVPSGSSGDDMDIEQDDHEMDQG